MAIEATHKYMGYFKDEWKRKKRKRTESETKIERERPTSVTTLLQNRIYYFSYLINERLMLCACEWKYVRSNCRCVCMCVWFISFFSFDLPRCGLILRVISMAKTKNGHNEINMYPTITIEKFTIVEQSTILVIFFYFFFFYSAARFAYPLFSVALLCTYSLIHCRLVWFGDGCFFHDFIRFIIYVPGYLFSFSCGFFFSLLIMFTFFSLYFLIPYYLSLQRCFSCVFVFRLVFFFRHICCHFFFFGKHCAVTIYTQR